MRKDLKRKDLTCTWVFPESLRSIKKISQSKGMKLYMYIEDIFRKVIKREKKNGNID